MATGAVVSGASDPDAEGTVRAKAAGAPQGCKDRPDVGVVPSIDGVGCPATPGSYAPAPARMATTTRMATATVGAGTVTARKAVTRSALTSLGKDPPSGATP